MTILWKLTNWEVFLKHAMDLSFLVFMTCFVGKQIHLTFAKMLCYIPGERRFMWDLKHSCYVDTEDRELSWRITEGWFLEIHAIKNTKKII